MAKYSVEYGKRISIVFMVGRPSGPRHSVLLFFGPLFHSGQEGYPHRHQQI
jgi:hypothetical protein